MSKISFHETESRGKDKTGRHKTGKRRTRTQSCDPEVALTFTALVNAL